MDGFPPQPRTLRRCDLSSVVVIYRRDPYHLPHDGLGPTGHCTLGAGFEGKEHVTPSGCYYTPVWGAVGRVGAAAATRTTTS
jgi:hypothetical protein